MGVFDYTIKPVEDVLSELGVDEKEGLGSSEAKKRFEKYGPNLFLGREVAWWQVLLRQFKSAFIYLLIIAFLIAFLLGEYIDSLMILLFLVINAVLGFYQEYQSEKTVFLLKKYVISYARVLRDGKKRVIKSELLVPGDIIFLETGDKIPADVRFLAVENLRIDESILTGESISINKQVNPLKSVASSYYQASNLGFSGTTVVDGSACAVVVATGKNSSIGKISAITQRVEKVSNFERGISHFANFIVKMIGLTLLVVFIANVLIKGRSVDVVELLLFSIALTVSVIPEALPVVATFSLSRGARRLAKKKVIVKRLSAVEDLGGIQVLCSDKTGTLTENKLTVVGVYGRNKNSILFYTSLAGAFDQAKKLEPFDLALWRRLSIAEKERIKRFEKIVEVPFNPKLKRNICLVGSGSSKTVLTRGAPEIILGVCNNIYKKEREEIERWVAKEGEQGRRVLAVARKDINLKLLGDNKSYKLAQLGDFEFMGVISFEDPIKKDAFDVVRKAKWLGVQIKILTGDSREVAGAVAYRIGISKNPKDVITADEWGRLDDNARDRALDKFSVFARVSPEQKYEIVDAYQKRYETGFLGEGINDAPVLKIAGVAIVVDSAADIAREAADIILLKKDLRIILEGIREGRKVFANTTKYIKATLTSNFGNFFAVAIASLITDFLPMLPLQLLLLNLLSDFPMIAVATDTVDRRELISPKKYEVKNIVLFSVIFGGLSTVFDFIFFGLFYRLGPSVLQTNWFIASVLTELVLIFSVRTRRLFLKSKFPSPLLLSLSLVAFIITLALPYLSLGRGLFSFTQPRSSHLSLVLSLVVLYFVLNEILKLAYYRKLDNKKKGSY